MGCPREERRPRRQARWKELQGDCQRPHQGCLRQVLRPWCGHCKTIAPKWVELGEHVKGSNLIMADFDATLNEVEGVEIKGYPTLKFYASDKKEGVDYSDGREVDDIKKWLAKNSAAYMAHFPEGAKVADAAADEKKAEL